MATRSHFVTFERHRKAMRSHRPGPRTNMELRGFKEPKPLLAAQSDDEGSIDSRALVMDIAPGWTSLVEEMNSDISLIKIKSARRPSALL